MKTLVAKGIDYSVLEVRKLENSKTNDINLVLIYPSGFVKKFQTSQHKLAFITETLDSIIYADNDFVEIFMVDYTQK